MATHFNILAWRIPWTEEPGGLEFILRQGFPGGSDSKESACNSGDPGSIPGSGRSFGGGNGNPFQYSFLDNPMDRGARWAAVHGVTILVSLMAQIVKNLPAMQETQVQSLGREDPLEKGKATHSSNLAWEIPRTEETGGLQFLGSQRVGYD